MLNRIVKSAGLVMLAGLALTTAAAADTWPDKPVRYVVPFPPGGGVDVVARIIAEKLSDRLGQQVIVENISGAGGMVGTRAAAVSPPDGYTMVAASFNFMTFPTLFKDLDFDIIEGFEPITLVATFPCVLVVNPTVEAKTVAELVAIAKAQPEFLKFGSSSAGGGGHIAGELFNQTAGLTITHVPYRGAAPMNVDLLGGHIHLAFAHITSILEFIEGGRVRPLAITSAERSPLLPDVPTMVEAGFPDFEAGEMHGILLPGGTPQPIVDRLNTEILAVLAMPDVRASLEKQGAQIVGNSPAEFAAFLGEQSAKWGEVATKAGVAAE